MPHDPNPGDVLLMITNGAYNDGTRMITFRIEDESTGRFIIDVALSGPDAETFAAALGNAVTRVSGARIGQDALAEKPEVAS